MPQRRPDVEFMTRIAENYERHFVPLIGAPIAADLVATAHLRSGERVLDVACGTGVVTKLTAARVTPDGFVSGVDVNPAMLAVARATTPTDVSIDWCEAAAEDLPFPDESFDAVLCGMGLQFFSDQQAALREFHRVLVRGGRLVANVPGPTPLLLQIMSDALAQHIGPQSATFVHTVFSLHDPDDVRDLATEAGFDDVEIRSAEMSLDLPPPAEFLRLYIGSTPLAAVVADATDQSRAALENEFSERCRALASAGPLNVCVRLTTLSATKQVDD